MLAQGVPEGRHIPTFQLGVYERNMELVKELQKLAKRKDCTPAQLAISWVKSLSGKVCYSLFI
jgi:pyridoxine 4-dehydrogenase